jgi:hypothetical protein
MRRVSAIAACSGLMFVGLVACSSTETPSPPTEARYDISFPSTGAAVATENVQVFVFDGDVAGTDCLTLATRRRTGQDLPPRLTETEPISPCELRDTASSESRAKGRLTNMTYGNRVFFAVATFDRGRDFLVGCAAAIVGAGTQPVEIFLSLASQSVSVPSTTCRELSTKCDSSCP